MPNGTAIMTTTLPTVVGMGVVSRATETMFGKGKGKHRKQAKRGKKRLVVYQGKRGGRYIVRKGRKVYL